MDAGEDDHLSLGPGGLDAQGKRITKEIGNLLNLLPLIIVDEQDGVLLPEEIPDLGLQRHDFKLVQPRVIISIGLKQPQTNGIHYNIDRIYTSGNPP
jgi:hypothetical protein